MKRLRVYVTGTNTGVGKTVVTCLLTRSLRAAGISVAAVKPVCSGDRADARRLHAASDGALSLAEVNPWFFRAPLTPLLAARRQGRMVKKADVCAHLRRLEKRFEAVILEGAGGLLSPLGVDFDSRDLILALGALPIVVCPNRLGALNQSLLALAALPRAFARRARLVLISPRRSDAVSRSNPIFLSKKLGTTRVHTLPWLRRPDDPGRFLSDRRLRRLAKALAG
jgi:dethiobiotin synthetase